MTAVASQPDTETDESTDREAYQSTRDAGAEAGTDVGEPDPSIPDVRAEAGGVVDPAGWGETAEAPLPTRAYAAAGWTGTEAVFWAGSNMTRNFAFTDSAAYDPATDTWRTLATPGWGHPGLNAAFVDGTVYAVAKGGGSHIDLATGQSTALASSDTMVLATIVATDAGLYGIGPRDWSGAGASELGIARYHPETDTWDEPIFHDGPDVTGGSSVQAFLIQWPVWWTGSEVVVWHGQGQGLAFDPATAQWRDLPPLWGDGGAVGDGGSAEQPTTPFTVAGSAGGNVVVLAADPASGGASAARLDGERWRWSAGVLPIAIDETTTVAAAGDWLVAFSPDGPPVAIHGPSGSWRQLAGGPEVQAPNTVWTGDRLVVWGGFDADGSGAAAIWTPPTASETTPPVLVDE